MFRAQLVKDEITELRMVGVKLNIIWSVALHGILTARNQNVTLRAVKIINNIKIYVRHIVKVKPHSEVTECLQTRNLIKLLASGFPPH